MYKYLILFIAVFFLLVGTDRISIAETPDLQKDFDELLTRLSSHLPEEKERARSEILRRFDLFEPFISDRLNQQRNAPFNDSKLSPLKTILDEYRTQLAERLAQAFVWSCTDLAIRQVVTKHNGTNQTKTIFSPTVQIDWKPELEFIRMRYDIGSIQMRDSQGHLWRSISKTGAPETAPIPGLSAARIVLNLMPDDPRSPVPELPGQLISNPAKNKSTTKDNTTEKNTTGNNTKNFLTEKKTLKPNESPQADLPVPVKLDGRFSVLAGMDRRTFAFRDILNVKTEKTEEFRCGDLTAVLHEVYKESNYLLLTVSIEYTHPADAFESHRNFLEGIRFYLRGKLRSDEKIIQIKPVQIRPLELGVGKGIFQAVFPLKKIAELNGPIECCFKAPVWIIETEFTPSNKKEIKR